VVVGRASELAAIGAFLDAAADGPGALLIAGEPGIGKTTLWREGVREARARSLVVLGCAPGELETKLTYSGLGDLFDTVPEEAFAGLAAPQRRALEHALLRDTAGAPPDQRAVAVALLETLRELAHERPVLVAIDDVQWLDVSSARVLEFAFRRLETEPVRLLLSRRTGEPLVGPLEQLLRSERLDELRVGPLDEAAIDSVLRSRLDAPFLRPTLRQIVRTSAGNPFLALELARALQSRGQPLAAGDPLPVPANLRELIAARLAGLSDRARNALLVVAALAQPTLSFVETVVGRTAGKALREAAEAGVIDLARGRIRFVHPLLEAGAYFEAPPEQRRELHRRLGGLLTDPEERGRHLALSTDMPDPVVAAALDEAAEHAGARGAPDAAGILAEQALRLTRVDDVGQTARRAAAAADWYFAAGETARSQQLLEEIVSLLPPGSTRARLLRRIARGRSVAQSFRQAEHALRQALDEAGPDEALRAALLRDLGFVAANYGDLNAAAAHLEASVALAEQEGDTELATDARHFLVGVQVQRGARAAFERAPAGPGQPGAEPMFQPHVMHEIIALKCADEFDQARSRLTAFHELLRERHEEGLLAPVLFHLAETECWSGELEAAARLANELADVSARARQPGVLPRTLYARAHVQANLGEVEPARAALAEGLALAGRLDDDLLSIRHLKTLGFLELSLGKNGEAHEALAQATMLAERGGYGHPGMLRFAADAIEACIAAGALDRARVELERLESQAAALGSAYAAATAGRGRGLLLAAHGDLDAAVAALESALRAHERLPQPLERARTLLAVGTIRRRMKKKALARQALEQAAEAFGRHGAAIWAGRTRAELGRLGGRPRSPAELTETERRVAALVAAGRTNKEVAAELFITVRTVEWNLSKIYSKLDVRSRTELARRL
jgi:DNA-binding NarL/FixJ family response regulator/predicted HD phosphohydrolase